MNNNAFVQFFENLAKAHVDLRHDEPGDYPTGKRKSFFRNNKSGEIVQAQNSQVDYPTFNLLPYYGNLYSSDSFNVEDNITGSFDIRKIVEEPFNFTEIENARDQCKQIALDIIAEMHRLWEEEGACGPIENFDVNAVTYDFIGPINDFEYGVRVSFTFRDEAYYLGSIDLDSKFQR